MNKTLTAKMQLVVLAGVVLAALSGSTQTRPTSAAPSPKFSQAVAFDVSLPLSTLVKMGAGGALPSAAKGDPIEVRPEGGPVSGRDKGYSGDGVLQSGYGSRIRGLAATIPPPLITFEGLSNDDNFALFGGRVNPPDPVGDVGPNHYVEMINLVFAVYDKQGNRLIGPAKLGSLWSGFPVTDCNSNAGDPVVLYDQLEDRWLLSQFTSAGPIYWNCVAISTTGDPTGSYYRYAFTAGEFFPDYPKYSVWKKSYVLTSRDFGPIDEYGISVYALEKNKMIAGNPNARAVKFFLDSAMVPLNLIGDGLLPADIDGNRLPKEDAPIPVIGTQDDNSDYGATFDALNIWELSIHWQANPIASIALAAQLPTAPFDSIYPCAPTSRDCLPEPGINDPNQFVDILSYRQRPTYRLAYRNFGTYEAMVTNQSVEARPAIAGSRWYEIRRTNGLYSLYQQGTYAPEDGVHRWMGSIAMDAVGNMALGYSVVDSVSVYPGIRYTGRMAGDTLGEMTLGEATVIDGTGVQRTTNSRWGDYTSMNIDPSDDCSFWYVNEYYTLAGQQSSTAGWQTRVGSFKLPGCKAKQ